MENVATFGRGLVGIVSAPPPEHRLPKAPGVMIVNPGMLSRVGNYRYNVNLARALYGHGIASIRVDLSGVGDSEPSPDVKPIREIWADDTLEAMTHLATTAKVDTFVVVGSCTGARIAAEAALRTSRIVGIVPINFDCPSAAARRAAMQRRRRYWIRPRWWREYGAAAVFRKLQGASEDRHAEQEPALDGETDFFGSDTSEVVAVWQRLLGRPTPVLAIYSEFDNHYDFFKRHLQEVLMRDGLGDQLELRMLKGADHAIASMHAQVDCRNTIIEWIHRRFALRTSTDRTPHRRESRFRGFLSGRAAAHRVASESAFCPRPQEP